MTALPSGGVHAGQSVTFIVSASDPDLRYPFGLVQDSFNYTWTASKGTISGGATATWSIPADAKGNINCQVVVDDVAQIPSGESGNRNDAPVTLTYSRTVPYASVQLLKPTETNQSGIVTIRYERDTVAATTQQLAIEYQEQASNYHTCEWTPILTQNNPATLISTTTDSDGVKHETYELTWNTLGLHNADYIIRVKGQNNCNCHSSMLNSFEITKTVSVKNLDITTCNPNGNVDYLRWDPDQNLQDTTIQSTLEDNGGTAGTTLYISIYHSDRTANPNAVRTVTLTTDSNPVKSYTWDGKDNNNQACPPGIYLFTVNAYHTQAGGTDSVYDHATDASVVEDRLLDVAGQDSLKDFQSKVSGTVADARITQFDPLLALISTTTGTSPLSSPTLYVTSDWLQVARVTWQPDKAGSYVFLMNGKDGTPANDKSHKARAVLGRNLGKGAKGIVAYDGAPANTEVASAARALFQIFDGLRLNMGWTTIPLTSGFVRSVSGTTHTVYDDVINAPSVRIANTFLLELQRNSIYIWVGHASPTALTCKEDPVDYLTNHELEQCVPYTNGSYGLVILLGCKIGDTAKNTETNIKQVFVDRGWRVIATTWLVPRFKCITVARYLHKAIDDHMTIYGLHAIDDIGDDWMKNTVRQAGIDAGLVYGRKDPQTFETINLDYFHE